jgi:hypothetical protein
MAAALRRGIERALNLIEARSDQLEAAARTHAGRLHQSEFGFDRAEAGFARDAAGGRGAEAGSVRVTAGGKLDPAAG